MLGSIQISGSHLSDAQVKDICTSVSEHKVPLLTLRKCKTKDKNFKALARAISKSKALLQLNVNLGLVCSRVRIFCLADALQLNRSITTLLLYGSALGDKGAIVICEALAQHPQIVTLDIGNCGLTDISIPYVAQLLPNYGAKPGLHELTLSANKEVTITGWTQFAMAMAAGCHLRSLYLDYNQLGDHGVGCFAVALATTKTLRFLDLEASDITTSGAQMLLHLLDTHDTSIRKLVLRGNNISRNVLKDIQEIMYERNRDKTAKDEEDYDSISSCSDSSSESDGYQLQPITIEEPTENQDDEKSSTTALDKFPIESDTNKDSKQVDQTPHKRDDAKQNKLNKKSIGSISDISDSTDEQTKKVSSDDSRLKTVEDYLNRDHPIHSNMYIHAEQRKKEEPTPSSKSMDDAIFSQILKASKDGYG